MISLPDQIQKFLAITALVMQSNVSSTSPWLTFLFLLKIGFTMKQVLFPRGNLRSLWVCLGIQFSIGVHPLSVPWSLVQRSFGGDLVVDRCGQPVERSTSGSFPGRSDSVHRSQSDSLVNSLPGLSGVRELVRYGGGQV